jgi:hypothetical protein
VNITKAISDLIWEKNQVELDLVISKKQLAETLIQCRIEEIKKERQQEEWKPLLSIEKILYEIFDMIPQIR